MVALCASRTSIENILQKNIKIVQIKTHQKSKFCVLHYWFLVKDVPKWANFRGDVKKTFNLK